MKTRIVLFKERIAVYDRPCGLVVRVPGYRTEMYRDCCEVRTEFIDRPCGLVVRVPGFRSIGPGSILGATILSEK
jgi:hypothetical protein